MPSAFVDIAPLVNNFLLLLRAHQGIFKQGGVCRRSGEYLTRVRSPLIQLDLTL